MSASRLRLNPTKTQVKWLGSRQQLQKVSINDISICLLSTHVRVTETARDILVVMDRQNDVAGCSRIRTPQVWLSSTAAASSSGWFDVKDASKTLVHAFVSSRLDYCNSLLYGIADGLLKKLQSIRNAAAH